MCLFFARTHSTPAGCNRTYYGNVGLTYDLELHRPKEEQMPYECVLTFSAAGGQQGDIVQVGKYECLCSSRRRRRRVIRPLRCVWHDNSRDYIAQSWRTNTQTGYGYMVNDDHHPLPPLPQPVLLANKVQRHNCTGWPATIIIIVIIIINQRKGCCGVAEFSTNLLGSLLSPTHSTIIMAKVCVQQPLS